MTEFDEDLIWDSITESAKGKINYAFFAGLFAFSPDNFLSSIIYGFAVGRTAADITAKIVHQAQMAGRGVDSAVLLPFVEDCSSLLLREISLTQQALRQLEEGEDEELVYRSVLVGLANKIL